MAKDILLDESGDLACVNADFVMGESSMQHIKLNAISNEGEWKESPHTGLGLTDIVNSDENISDKVADWKRKLKRDGCKDVEVDYDENTGKLILNGIYD